MDSQLKRILETTLRMMPQTLGDQQLAMLRSGLEEEGSAVRILWESTVQACWVEQSQGDVAWDILQAAFRSACADLAEESGAELGAMMESYLNGAMIGKGAV